jgi:hypothetical protein
MSTVMMSWSKHLSVIFCNIFLISTLGAYAAAELALPVRQCSSFPPQQKIDRCLKLIESGRLKSDLLAEAHSEIAQAYLEKCPRENMLPCLDAGIKHLTLALQAHEADWMIHSSRSAFWGMRATIDDTESSLLHAVLDATNALEHMHQKIDLLSEQALKYRESAALRKPFRFSGMYDEYAERGDLYVRLCRFREAAADFEIAIKLLQMHQQKSDEDTLEGKMREYRLKLEDVRSANYRSKKCAFSDVRAD